MRIGQLVKLKRNAEIQFAVPEYGSVNYVNKCEKCYCIVMGFADHNGTYEVLLDGDVGFNVYPDNLEAIV